MKILLFFGVAMATLISWNVLAFMMLFLGGVWAVPGLLMVGFEGFLVVVSMEGGRSPRCPGGERGDEDGSRVPGVSREGA